jgi:hypothetical protein
MSGALPVDPGIAALTRNALHHFGVQRAAAAGAHGDDPADAPARRGAFAGDGATSRVLG